MRSDCSAFGFQGHPEASPGPHDLVDTFDRFITLMQARRAAVAAGLLAAVVKG